MEIKCIGAKLLINNLPNKKKILIGTVLSFTGNPFQYRLTDSVNIAENTAVLIDGNKIKKIGSPNQLVASAPDAEVYNFQEKLLMSGFIDAHAHYPQTPIIASWGKRLIDWLNTYTFPEEEKYSNSKYAENIAELYLNFLISNGTTSVSTYCTTHPESVDAIFSTAQRRNMCVVAGKNAMDRNAPKALLDTPQSAYDESKKLIHKWHRTGRLRYAITPRFSPTSSPEQLSMLGELWAEYPDCLMQTHLSEQVDEIEWVKSLFPNSRDYLDTYEQFGLLGANAIFGHAIHLKKREIDRLKDVGAGVVHCPTSNTFIGSGLFDMEHLQKQKIPVGLATDTGGGSSFSMLRTMASCYEIAQLRNNALHPAQLLWLATMGSAKALHLEKEIGNLKVGYIADVIAIDLKSTDIITQRADLANDIWEAIFPTLMMGDDRAIAATFIAGNLVHSTKI
jgi:guanine deaminase